MSLMEKAKNPLFWSETVRNGECYQGFVKYNLDNWEKRCLVSLPLTELTYSDYKIFFETGNRAVYEDQYFRRRHILATSAVLSLIYPEEEKYLKVLQDTIFAVCNEYAWCVPAHHPDINVENRTHIDLFASETGFTLSMIHEMLGERLDPVIRQRIKTEVNHRIIDSFANKRDYWWEVRCSNNWAAVCAGSVGCTYMLMRPELYASQSERFDAAMARFLSGYHDDGFCLEGTHYWHYGFGFFTIYADMLYEFTGGEQDYFKLGKVKSISTFIQKTFLSETASISFADGHLNQSYHIGICHFLKKKYPDAVKVYDPKYGYYGDGCARFCHLIASAAWLDEEIYKNPEDNCDAEYFADEAGWFIKRNGNYGFAAKGGNNGEHHNHNDVGAFIFAKDGKQLITDMGSGKYCKQYFGEERYTFIECKSTGHSVPFFCEAEQKTGKAFAARDTVSSDGYFKTDIAGAYGMDSLKSLVREFKLDEKSVTLTDTFDYCGNDNITERFASCVEPCVECGRITVDNAVLTFDSSLSPTVSSTVTSRGLTVYFIDFTLPADTKTFTLTIE